MKTEEAARAGPAYPVLLRWWGSMSEIWTVITPRRPLSPAQWVLLLEYYESAL